MTNSLYPIAYDGAVKKPQDSHYVLCFDKQLNTEEYSSKKDEALEQKL